MQVDEGDIVQVDDEDAVFLPGPDNIVRYHASGITISKMGDTGDTVSIYARWRFEGCSELWQGNRGTNENWLSNQCCDWWLVLWVHIQCQENSSYARRPLTQPDDACS